MLRNNISLDTKLAGLIGYPLGHSASPAMHNSAYSDMGLDAVYLPIEIKTENVKQMVEDMELLKFIGCNVTIPHKQTVIPLMDELDESAAACGAVNTIAFKNGKKIGYNTDGMGFVRAMREKAHFDPTGKRCIVIGAGGAARGVTSALAMAGSTFFTIFNRAEEIDMARGLSDDMNRRNPNISCAKVLTNDAVKEALSTSDFVLHATSLGMSPNESSVAFDTNMLESRHAVFDVVYNPRETRLLREAKARGCITLGGLWMLIYQGAEAVKIWTGKDAPVDVMERAAEVFLAHSK